MVGLFGDDTLQDHNHQLRWNGSESTSFVALPTKQQVRYVDDVIGDVRHARKSTVTQGKRKGVKYIIKAL